MTETRPREHRKGPVQLRGKQIPDTTTDERLLSLLRTAAVETIHTREASLRDVFIAVTGGRR